jgi:serine protease
MLREFLSRARRGAALAVLLGFALPVLAGDPGRPVGSLIVKLRDAPEQHRKAALAVRGERLARVFAEARVPLSRQRAVGRAAQRVDLGRRVAAAEAGELLARLRARPEVEWAVPNERERRLQVPTDPLFAAGPTSSGQWWLFPAGGSDTNDIDDRRRGVADIQSAWATGTGGTAPVIAVLDTGVSAHPDLDAQVLPGYDFVSTVEYANDGDGRDADASDPGDWVDADDRSAHPALFDDCDLDTSSWHGTAIAGILAATVNNGVGGAGAVWGGRVLPVRVAGKCGAEVADILDGMRWAAGLPVLDDRLRPLPPNPNPARIVNISFGGSAACNAAYQDTIDELREHGVLVVAAAGNDSGALTRPASCRGVLGVVALNRDGFKSTYSNFGAPAAIATAGGDPRLLGAWGLQVGDDGLLTTGNAGARGPTDPQWGRQYGSSFAAPVAAGVAALMLALNPDLGVDQLIDGLQRSARPHVQVPRMAACSAENPGRCQCDTASCGAGMLDAPQALAYALAPASYVAPARSPEIVDNAEVWAAVASGPDQRASVETRNEDDEWYDKIGGALDVRWLLGLGLALVALARRRRG